MAELLAEERPDAVFHLAAQIDVRRAVAEPAFDAAVNVGGTAAMLEAARAAGTRRFVLASTGGALYGETDRLPTPEDAPVAPLSPYGAPRPRPRPISRLYARLHGLSTVALRFANVYGPRQDPLGEGGVIAIYCHAARTNRRVRVFGDGGQTRDFVYVGDAVAAMLAAADRDVAGAYNIGTGEETAVLELVERLDLEPTFEPERPGEIRRSCLDASAAREALGWTALTDARRRPRAHGAVVERRRAPDGRPPRTCVSAASAATRGPGGASTGARSPARRCRAPSAATLSRPVPQLTTSRLSSRE